MSTEQWLCAYWAGALTILGGVIMCDSLLPGLGIMVVGPGLAFVSWRVK